MVDVVGKHNAHVRTGLGPSNSSQPPTGREDGRKAAAVVTGEHEPAAGALARALPIGRVRVSTGGRQPRAGRQDVHVVSRPPRRRPVAFATATARDRRPRARRHTERRSALATSQQPTWPFDHRIAHLMLIFPFSRGHDSRWIGGGARKTQTPCRRHDSRLGDVSAAEIYRQQASKHLALVVGFALVGGDLETRGAVQASDLSFVGHLDGETRHTNQEKSSEHL